MSNRFKRDYELTIGLGASVVTIRPPFSIAFSATENVFNKALNKLNMKISGLQQSTRLKLIKYELDKDKYFPIEFKVGYQGEMYRAFKGSVRIGDLDREGATFVNNLECYDGHPDFTKAFTSKTVKGRKLSIDAILEDMPNTTKGAITGLAKTLRPKVLVGSSSELLAKIAEGKEFYIKDEKIFMLNSDEVISAVAPLVSAQTGLKIGIKQDHIDTTFTTVLNPTLKVGGLCVIESVTNPDANGTYKIYQITTSGAYLGEWVQIVTCRTEDEFKVIR